MRKALTLLCIAVCWSLLPAQNARPYVEFELPARWAFSEAGKANWKAAEVPGTVHTDLLKHRDIPDPFFAMNESSLQWIGETDWEYQVRFAVDANLLDREHLELVFEGLDTYADIYLNDILVLQTDNMFRTWVLDARGKLAAEENHLRIRFRAPNKVADSLANALPYKLPMDNDGGARKISSFVRKAPYQFGWDWSPRFLTMGIWKPVYLRAWDGAHIAAADPITQKIKGNQAWVDVDVTLNTSHPGPWQLQVYLDDVLLQDSTVTVAEGRVRLPLSIADPKLWWTNGLGQPHLYDLEVALQKDGREIDRWQQKMGIRTLELVQDPDSMGTAFTFLLNGQPLFIKGANYIPEDNFIPRGQVKTATSVAAAKSAHMNMLRVWGGGIYGSEDFYDLCDQNGILVWQDFMFACSMYPGDQAFLQNVAAEVSDNVRRLRHHPSLAMWCGNNESEVGWFNWGWQEKYAHSAEDSAKIWQHYQQLFERLIPEVLDELDPGRPYISSSPISNWGTPDNFNHGNMHYWGVWHGEEPFEEFKHNVPRFMSEYGFPSYPDFRTMRTVSAREDWSVDSEMMRHRQKSYKGNGLINTHMDRWYNAPKNFSSYLVLTQLLQAEALRIAVRHHRIAQPHCMGTLYWQLNDCWPGPSWSTLDYYGREKAGHYWLRDLYAPLMITAVDDEKKIDIHMVSDLQVDRRATLQLRLKDFKGGIVWSYETTLEIPSRSARKVYSIEKADFPHRIQPTAHVLETVVHAGGEEIATDLLYFAAPRDLDLPDPEYDYHCTETAAGFQLEFDAHHAVKNIQLGLPDPMAEFSTNYFDLVPGRVYKVNVQSERVSSCESLMQQLRLRNLKDWME